MAGTKKLQVIITGDSKGAERAMASTGKSATGLSSKFSKFQKVAGASFLVAGGAAVAFGKKSADTYKKIGGEISKLERLTGLGAEDASKLRFAFQQSGISAEAGSRGIAAFSKKVTSSKDGMKDFGFNVRDASGNLLPMNKLVDLAADRLAGMENGAEKNALAMKLFGKGGLDMVKVLGKGSKGLAKLSAEAEKYGLVLTEDNLEAVKKTVAASRDQEAAMQGLQLQIGMHVLPLITKLTTVFATAVPKITEFTSKHQWVAKVLGGVVAVALAAYIVSMGSAAVATLAATWPVLAIIAAVAALALGLKWAYNNVGWFHDAVDAASKYITGTAVPALKLMWAWFSEKILPIIKAVARFYATVWVAYFRVGIAAVVAIVRAAQVLYGYFVRNVLPVIRMVASSLAGQFRTAFAAARNAIGWLAPKLASAISYLRAMYDAGQPLRSFMAGAFATSMQLARNSVGWLVDRARGLVSMLNQIVSAARSAASAISSIPSKIPGAGLVGGALGGLFGRAAGGPVTKGVPYIVGEVGPELFVPNSSGTIIPNNRIAMPTRTTAAAASPGAAASGAPVYLTVRVEGSVVAERQLVDVVRSGLIDIGRRTGRPVLAGLA